ncbi:dTMP kinase [Salinarimonas ramus]|uniref:Thymidylate kinase n=1 Tax=Salinarimonas ramus TaxID=690164 RepID=A0A917QFJ8_9HYPH|nr:dTMP kinase [Salinarimonas ramus]GGK48182.1 thymidylate kinase [Salinarimonas ramus]
MGARFITFEGGEGTGKSTQIARLAERLRSRGYAVVTTREPGGSPHAEELRRAILSGEAKKLGPFAEALLFARARQDHLEATIRPALAAGAIVLCDRFADSTRAYQGAAGSVATPLIDALERCAVGETRPDLTLILDLPVATALARAASRREGTGAGEGADRYEGEALAFHEKLREAFHAIAAREPERCVVIDASGDVETVEARIAAAVEPRLGHATPVREEPAAEPDVVHG